MTQKLLSATFIIMLVCSIVYFTYDNESTKPTLPTTHTSEDVIAYEKALKKWKRNNGYRKSNQPKKYMDILNRMKYRPTGQNYTSGYQIKELKKAMQRSNSRIKSDSAIKWIERGPSNSPGRTRSAIVDPTDATGNTILIGAVGGGIWKTTDKGKNWTNLTEVTSTSIAISCMAVAPSNSKIWYAGTGEGFSGFGSIVGNGIMKSTDGGNTWAFLSSLEGDMRYETIYKIIVDPENHNTILMAASTRDNTYNRSAGIYKSTDGGNNWTSVYNANTYVESLIFEPNNFDVMYATSNNDKFIKSTDAGETWDTLSASGVIQQGRVEMDVSPANVNVIFANIAGEGSGSTDGNLYISRDKGATWNFVTLNNNSYAYLGGQGWYDHTVLAHPFDETVVYVGGVNLSKIKVSANNTGVFTELSDAYGDYDGAGPNDADAIHPDQHFMTIGSINQTNKTFSLIVTNDGGIYHTNDVTSPGEGEGTWLKIGNGVNTTQIYAIDKFPNQKRYFFGTQDNGSWITPEDSTANAGTEYRPVIGGDGFASYINKRDSSQLIGSYTNNQFEVSSDGGNSFSAISAQGSGLTDMGRLGAPFMSMLANNHNAPDTLFTVGYSGVWKSTDFGKNWTGVTISENWNEQDFLDVEVSEKSPLVVWAGGAMDGNDRIFVSKDGGRSFTATSNFNFINSHPGNISGLATSPNNDSTAYVMFSFLGSAKIIKTTDFGETWNDITGFEVAANARTSDTGFPDVAVFDVLEFPGEANKLWAATEIGIFETKNGGSSWSRLESNFPAVSVWDIKIYDNQVIAGTHGRGAWTHDLTDENDGNGDGDGSGDGDGDNGEDTVTSIIQTPSILDISIVKSPLITGESLSLNINSDIKTTLEIEIISITGQSIYTEVVDQLKIGNYQYKVAHPILGNGTYVLRLSYSNEVRSLKFLVQ
ncbi:sialidase family protein [Flammeovirga aprica]|uniref:Sortilin N-terminal domain-containing protein n=1 Tax=Flammeovirga aprica JL-4 TaxID=694437 RepID=A0A7X9P2P0_9BACT|nr:sialidase family protein [Flammeovirga aprica]NME68441.1 hypothetical protein [Flammeovirga aprica JL-4]